MEEAWAADRGWRASVRFPARMVPSLQEMSRFHTDTDTPNVPSRGLQTLRTQVLPEASEGLRPILPAWLSSMCTRRWPGPREPDGPIQLAQGHQQLGKQWAVGPAVARARTKAWALPRIEAPSFMACQGRGQGSLHREVRMFCKDSSGRAVATNARRGADRGNGCSRLRLARQEAGERGALTPGRWAPHLAPQAESLQCKVSPTCSCSP